MRAGPNILGFRAAVPCRYFSTSRAAWVGVYWKQQAQVECTVVDVSESQRFSGQAERLYEQYGKPLEAEHRGKFLAVHPDGRMVLTDDYETMKERALAELGMGNYFFRVGPRAIYRRRYLRLLPDGESQAIRRAPSSLVRRIDRG